MPFIIRRFRAYIAFWKIRPAVCVISTYWHCRCPLRRPFRSSYEPPASGWWETVRPPRSINRSTLPRFRGWEMSSFSSSKSMWDAMMLDKEFGEQIDDGLVRSITCRKGKFITRISFFFSKENAHRFHDGGSLS